MARVKNTMRLIEKSMEKIHPKYDLCSSNLQDILEEGRDPYDLIVNGFRFGYMQGMKAAKAEMKRK